MVIFLNMDGTAEKITPQHVFQGSNNVTEITVVAPYTPDTALEIGFILPDGLYWNEPDGPRYAPMAFVGQNAETRASAWNYVLPQSVTERQGEVFAAINARTVGGNTTSFLCRFTVEESVLPKPPSEPEPDVYELLLLYLARLDGRTVNVPNLVAKIQKVAGNAFTYTNNSGVESAPIVMNSGEDAPISFGAASAISVPKDAWIPVYAADKTTVTGYIATVYAAMHGQMTNGATANDLWVSFDEAGTAGFAGAYEDYTVDSGGNITISVSTPIAMTIRVWNGKGLIDEAKWQDIIEAGARAEQSAQAAEQSAERAEQASTEAQGTANTVEDYVNKYLADAVIRVANRTLIINPTADNITVDDRTLIFTAQEV